MVEGGTSCLISHLQSLLPPQAEPVVYAVNIGETQFLGSQVHHLEVNQISNMTSDYIKIVVLLYQFFLFSVNEGVCLY